MKTDSKFILLIPNKIPGLLKANRELQRITATLLLLRSLYPEGRFKFDDIQAVATQCGFKSRKGFKLGHLDKLKQHNLLQYENNEEHKTCYVSLASWQSIKQHFGYERNFFIKHEVCHGACTSNAVLAILKAADVQKEESFFHTSFRTNLNGNPELKEAIETVCGNLSRAAIHHYQLTAFTDGLPSGMSEEYYNMAYMLLHATKTAKSANSEDDNASRFFLKADTNVSTGYLSRAFGYKRRNGFCYWKKKLQLLGLVSCQRREYTVKKRLRTTTAQRCTGLGQTYYDPREMVLKLRMVDQWTFISASVAFGGNRKQLQVAVTAKAA